MSLLPQLHSSLPPTTASVAKLTDSQWICENQWFDEQSVDVRQQTLVLMLRHSVPIGMLCPHSIADTIVHHIDANVSALLAVARSDVLLLVMGKLSDVCDEEAMGALFEAIFREVLVRITRSGFRGWIYDTFYDRCRTLCVSLSHRDSDLARFRAVSAVHANVFRTMRRPAHFRVFTVRSAHVRFVVDLARLMLVRLRYAQLDVLFVHYTCNLRHSLVKYLLAATNGRIDDLVRGCPHIRTYMQASACKLTRVLSSNAHAWTACCSGVSAAPPKTAAAATTAWRLLHASNLTHVIEELFAEPEVAADVSVVYACLQKLPASAQRASLECVVQRVLAAGAEEEEGGATAVAAMTAFLLRYPKYAIRHASLARLPPLLAWSARAHTAAATFAAHETTLFDMIMCVTLCHTKRTRVIEACEGGSPGIRTVLALCARFEGSVRSLQRKKFCAEGILRRRVRRLVSFVERQFKLIFDLGLLCTSRRLSASENAEGMKTAVSLLRHVCAFGDLIMPWTIAGAYYTMCYFALVEGECASTELCSLCGCADGDGDGDAHAHAQGEEATPSLTNYRLSCGHTFHSECLLNALQCSMSGAKYPPQCPYCTQVCEFYNENEGASDDTLHRRRLQHLTVGDTVALAQTLP